MILIKKSPSHKHLEFTRSPMRISANPCLLLEQKRLHSGLRAAGGVRARRTLPRGDKVHIGGAGFWGHSCGFSMRSISFGKCVLSRVRGRLYRRRRRGRGAHSCARRTLLVFRARVARANRTRKKDNDFVFYTSLNVPSAY
jgi:hypothetical protein